MNPMIAEFVGDCQDLLGRLEETASQLAYAIQQDIAARRTLRELEEALSAAEAELVASAAIKAKTGQDSPLAGLAVTSPAYRAALDALLADARRNGLGVLAHQVEDMRRVVDDTEATRRTWEVRFSAIKHAAELRAAMLKVYGE